MTIVKRLAIAGLVLMALWTSAVRVPATVCPVASAPIGKACKQGCCASKACCAESQKNHSLPAQPLAKDNGSNQQQIAVLAPQFTTIGFEFHPCNDSPDSTAKHVVNSTPRPALLCTFLI